MNNIMTAKEWESELGRQLKELRLRRNYTQARLAEESGISLNVIKKIENGKGGTINAMIKILKIMGREEWLATLSPSVSISPIQMLKSRTPRQRASSKRNKGNV